MKQQPPQLNLLSYPTGDAEIIVDFDRLVTMMTADKLIYLNGKVGQRLLAVLEDNIKQGKI